MKALIISITIFPIMILSLLVFYLIIDNEFIPYKCTNGIIVEKNIIPEHWEFYHTSYPPSSYRIFIKEKVIFYIRTGLGCDQLSFTKTEHNLDKFNIKKYDSVSVQYYTTRISNKIKIVKIL